MEQNSLPPKKLRNAILTKILEENKLDKDLVRKHNGILQSFLHTFIPEMKKQDKLFESLFQCIYFTGSYYSNLRVSEPNEYDLNILLKLPYKEKYISVEYHPQVPSYAKCRIKNESVNSGEDGLNKLFENGFLMPGEVRSWIQSVVDKALVSYRRPKKLAQGVTPWPENILQQGLLKHSANLPSPLQATDTNPKHPLEQQPKAGDPQDDVSFQRSNLKGTHRQNKNRGQKNVGKKVRATLNQLAFGGISSQRRKNKARRRVRHRFPARCFLVPKPYKPSKQAPVSDSDTECACLWRAHYPKAEEVVIHDLGCVKPIIKLLKLLRDKEDWKILASYYLKTIVMWMIIENSDEESWRMDHLGEKFLEALKNLQNYVGKREIPYFFNSRYNLLEKLSVEQASNIQDRLCIITRDIERDNEKLWDIFGCPQSLVG